jgi:hypothetical protein
MIRFRVLSPFNGFEVSEGLGAMPSAPADIRFSKVLKVLNLKLLQRELQLAAADT